MGLFVAYSLRIDSLQQFLSYTVITSLIALHYMRLEHRREVEEVIDSGRKVRLFLSREAMIKYLLEMNDKAEVDDVLSAQCVRCSDFTP